MFSSIKFFIDLFSSGGDDGSGEDIWNNNLGVERQLRALPLCGKALFFFAKAAVVYVLLTTSFWT